MESAQRGTCGRSGRFRENLQIASDRKSTRLNSSHMSISYAVFWLKKKSSEKKAAGSGAAARAVPTCTVVLSEGVAAARWSGSPLGIADAQSRQWRGGWARGGCRRL